MVPVNVGMLTACGPGRVAPAFSGNTLGVPATNVAPPPSVYGFNRLVVISTVRAAFEPFHLMTTFSISYSFLMSITIVGAASPELLHVVLKSPSSICQAVPPRF